MLRKHHSTRAPPPRHKWALQPISEEVEGVPPNDDAVAFSQFSGAGNGGAGGASGARGASGVALLGGGFGDDQLVPESTVLVAVRVRPMAQHEIDAGAACVVAMREGGTVIVVDPTALRASLVLEEESRGYEQLDVSAWSRRFAYDHCYWSARPPAIASAMRMATTAAAFGGGVGAALPALLFGGTEPEHAAQARDLVWHRTFRNRLVNEATKSEVYLYQTSV